MKKITTKMILSLACLLGLVSCSDFLNVQPEDEFLESQVYDTRSGIHSALNGVYVEIAEPQLYGRNMSMGALDILAQYYNFSDDRNSRSVFADYSYGDATVTSTFDQVWVTGYTSILDCNNFIENMEAYPEAITKAEADLLRGEAIGLRAMLHFDMLRLFGPMYNNNASEQAVPYYTKVSTQANDILPATEVIEKVLADLQTAAELLQEDPIISEGVQASLESTGENFFRFRNRRMNFYAVKAMQARVHLYAGNNSEALAAATTVIDNAQQWFPWTPPEDIVSAGANPDRVFSSEIIFGIENRSMYNQQQNLFSADLLSTSIVAPLPSRLENTYEANENDYRYNPWWKIPTTGGKSYRTFFKYAEIPDVPGNPSPWKHLQSLIRMSEMYYIAAETVSDDSQALEYLNTVRFNRGLQDLPPSVDIEAEIQKEYRKEFYGEGQLFFYYKRKASTTIPNGSSSFGDVSMGASQYVVPLPDSELEFRN